MKKIILSKEIFFIVIAVLILGFTFQIIWQLQQHETRLKNLEAQKNNIPLCQEKLPIKEATSNEYASYHGGINRWIINAF